MELHVTELLGGESDESLGTTGRLIGKSSVMLQVFDLAMKLAKSTATVLIGGESGTGKEMIARTIHDLSPRAQRPFVPVNCGAIPEDLLESELFGHTRGAFTGAGSARQGRFQLAHGGTLFLDEVGEMSPKLQVKLLRVLQEQEFEPVGSDKSIRVDVRVIAATNRDLQVAVKEGRFRGDLFYRLHVLPLHLPPLRERHDDIATLLAHFLRLHSRKKDRIVDKIEPDALSCLQQYSWPGNVRELENLVERLVVLNDDGVIRILDLPDYVRDYTESSRKEKSLLPSLSLPVEGVDLDGLLQELENDFILQALSRTRGNKTLAAELLRVNRTTLIERMRKRGLEAPHYQILPPPWSAVRRMTTSDFSLTSTAHTVPSPAA